MFRRGGKLSLFTTKDDRIKVINERINLTEKHLMELCSCFASCTRKLAKSRNTYDELAKGFKTYAEEEDINESLCDGLKSFTNSVTILADYMDIEVHRMELKIINELSQFENICKATRENLRLAVIARDKEVLRQKQMQEIKSKFSANTSAADSELMKAKLEVNRTNKEIDEIINNFEKRKLHDLKQLLENFVLISMKRHTKSLEVLSATYYDISNIDEKNDLKEFQKLMKSNEDYGKKHSLKKSLRTTHSMDSLDRDEPLSPGQGKRRLTRSTRDLSVENHSEDEMFRRGGKLSLFTTKDDRIKVINERINLTEKHLMELCSCFASCTRKLAKSRNTYDELAKGFKTYAEEEDINESLCDGLKSFTNSVTILADYMDIEVHRMELKIINELSQFENICKATRENLRLAVIARDKEVLRQKQMQEIKSKFSANTSAADSELMKAKLEVNRTNKEIDEIINNFEKRKLHDLKQLLENFVLISMKRHTKSLEVLSATYYDISNIDEKNDLKEFQKLMKSNEDYGKKHSLKKSLRTTHSMDSLDRDEPLSPGQGKRRLTRSTRDLSVENHSEDEDEEDDDEEAEEEEECSESEQSASDDEEQSDETESDFPNKRKKSSSRTPKPKPTTSTIGIPKESSKSAFGHLVTVAEIRTDAPTAAPRQPIDCTTKNK